MRACVRNFFLLSVISTHLTAYFGAFWTPFCFDYIAIFSLFSVILGCTSTSKYSDTSLALKTK